MSFAALAILLLVDPASAGDLPKVAVVGLHQTELDATAQTKAVEALSAALEGTGQVAAASGDQVAAAVRGREAVILADGLLGQGRRLLADGRNLYNQAQPEDAALVLQQAVSSLALGQAAANNTKDLWEAWIYLGTALQDLERAPEAEAAFRAAAALNPSRTPNPAIFPPPVVEAYDAARAALAPYAMPLIVSADASATVYVDGEEKGKGAVTVQGVYPGEHHVLAIGAGAQAYQRVNVPLSSGSMFDDPSSPAPSVKVELVLGQPSLGSAADSATGRAQQTAALYRALGEHAADVDLLLLAGVDGSQVHVQLYAPSTDAFSTPKSVPFQGAAYDEAAEQIPTLIGMLEGSKLASSATAANAVALDLGANTELASLLLHPREAPATLPGGGPTEPKKKRTALWVALGAVGVAAAGTGTALGIAASGASEPVGNGTIIVGPF